MPTGPRPRRVSVDAERLGGWLDRFAARHGDVRVSAAADEVVVEAADGSEARIVVPFPPLRPTEGGYAGLVDHVLAPRRLGLLLVRLGGFAAGVVQDGSLVRSKVGSRPVHGRSAAGGWSQQRFARRREGQVRVAQSAAADTAAAVLLPEVGSLDALVVGGDRRSVDAVLADPRLVPLRGLVTGDLLDVPDPRRKVLDDAARRCRAVTVWVVDVGVSGAETGRLAGD